MATAARRPSVIRIGAAVATAALLIAFALVLVQAQVRAREEWEARSALRTAIAASFVSRFVLMQHH